MNLRTQYLVVFWFLMLAILYQWYGLMFEWYDAGAILGGVFNIWLIILLRNMAVKIGWVKELKDDK